MSWIWSDIKSLAPLPQSIVQPIPQLGGDAPSFRPIEEEAKEGATELVYPLKDGKKSVVVFVRHLGCPFCQETIQDIYPIAKENRDIRFFLVSQSDVSDVNRTNLLVQRLISRSQKTEDVEVYLDNVPTTRLLSLDNITIVSSPPPHTLYSTWGISQLTFTSLFSPSGISSAIKLRKERGIKNTETHGSRWLSSGAFAVDQAGKVVWTHVARSADDVSDLKAAVASLKHDN
ncbi:hypothetical protein FRB94_011597 [Tulasnella sp. JGI-2019a]|nr:hypothetical protein FRB94_011597 [Tulasnella sp. JGI-2019a]